MALQRFVELPVRAHLHERVDVLLVREDRVQPHDVAVVHEGLDLQLAGELLLQLGAFCLAGRPQLLLVEHLQRPDEAGLPVPESTMPYIARKTVPCLPLPSSRMISKQLMVSFLLRWGRTLWSVSLRSSSLDLRVFWKADCGLASSEIHL